MKKVLVIGCPGGGKSTFSRELSARTGIPVVHLDNLYWRADGTGVERDVFLARLHEVLAEDRWIIDGNYSSTMAQRLTWCDTVFFLDYPTEICLEGVRLRRGKARSDIPWVEYEEDAEFMDYIRRFPDEQRPKILSLLSDWQGGQVIVFCDRAESEAYLSALSGGQGDRDEI